MEKFYLTFGSRYAYEPHPTFPAATPDGYVTIVAEDYSTARAFAFETFGDRWSSIYEEHEALLDFYPVGELESFTVTPN